MGAVAEKISLQEFERLYGDRKPYHEYWFGKAAPKAMASWQHGFVQKISMRLLDQAGYKSASEVKLKISPEFEPVPDVVATRGSIDERYPTKPLDVVVEILSPEDPLKRLERKCRLYSEWGIPNVFVIDPEDREAWKWDSTANWLVPITVLTLDDRVNIPIARLFEELDAELAGD